MDAIVHRISAWDGFPLVVREWRDGDVRASLLCLPGIVRTSGDFEALAQALGTERRVVAVDYPGRGQSGRSRDIMRYAPEACLRDVLDICAALHLHDVISIGTSFGGLVSMGLAAARPSLFRAAVLNDIGPELGSGGTDFVRRFIGHDAACDDIDTAAPLDEVWLFGEQRVERRGFSQIRYTTRDGVPGVECIGARTRVFSE